MNYLNRMEITYQRVQKEQGKEKIGEVNLLVMNPLSKGLGN